MFRMLLSLITIGMLVSCSDVASPVNGITDETGLTVAQLAEIADLQALANAGPESLEAFVPTEEWEELHPGIWWREKVSEAGEVVGHSLHASGVDALRWVAEELWPSRIAEVAQLIEDAEAAGESTESLRARLRQYESLQERLLSAEAGHEGAPLSQGPHVRVQSRHATGAETN